MIAFYWFAGEILAAALMRCAKTDESRHAGALTWINSRGEVIDLATAKVITIGECAQRMRRSTEWVLRKIRAGELYPVLRHNARSVEVFEPAISDWLDRASATAAKNVSGATPSRSATNA